MSRYARDNGHTDVWVDAGHGDNVVSDSVPIYQPSVGTFFQRRIGTSEPVSDTAIHLHVHTGDRGPDTPPAIRDLTGGDPDAYPRDLDDLHGRLVRWFEESEMARMDEIELAQRDRVC